MGLLRVRYDWATSLSLFTFMHWRRKWQPTPVFLPGESQGRGSLVGCHLWGRRVGHDWSDLAAAAAAFYLLFMTLARTSSTMLINSGVYSLGEKAFSLSTLSVMLAVGVCGCSLASWSSFSLFLAFCKFLKSHEWMLNFVKKISALIDMIMLFSLYAP